MYEIAAWICLLSGAIILGIGFGGLLALLIKVYMWLFEKLLELFRIKQAFLWWIFTGMPGVKKRKGGNG